MHRILLRGIFAAVSVFGVIALVPASATDLPDAVLSTGGCVTSVTPNTQTCDQHSVGIGSIFSQAQLNVQTNTQTATAQIDMTGPYSFLAQASVTYYMELTSSTGNFPNDYFFTIPIQVSANGSADVGGVPPINNSGFNHNTASATVKVGSFSWYACAGFSCPIWAETSFDGPYQVDLKPGSSGSLLGPNIFEISVLARAETNSSYPSSFAHAFADPIIRIDPVFLAAHPEYSLSFSPNLAPVPEPDTAWLFGSGVLLLIAAVRRRYG
jgi:hypothetical protein